MPHPKSQTPSRPEAEPLDTSPASPRRPFAVEQLLERAAAKAARRRFTGEPITGFGGLADARQVQRAIDDSYSAAGQRAPVGEARELELGDLMPMERATLGRAWADTEATL
jgi:hypothetical protein